MLFDDTEDFDVMKANVEKENAMDTEERIDSLVHDYCKLAQQVKELTILVKTLQESIDVMAQAMDEEEPAEEDNTKILNVVTRETKNSKGVKFTVYETNDLQDYGYAVQLDLSVRKLVENWQLKYDPQTMEVIIKPNGYPMLTLRK